MKARKTILAAAAAVLMATNLSAARNAPWPKDKAWEWYRAQPWIRGCNYMPASAANRVDQWQELGSEERFAEVERELALAESIGFNTLRILVEECGFGVWLVEHDGFMERFERMLSIMQKHKMRAIVVLGNDCSRPKPIWSLPRPGVQQYDWGYHGGRKRSQHGSFVGQPGYTSLDDPELNPKFFQMCRELLSKYRNDDRILFWNLWNEPGNSDRHDISVPHIRQIFDLAWEIDPKQPLASDVWSDGLGAGSDPNKAQALGARLSDIISYHTYGSIGTQTRIANTLKERFGRPMFITEWLARVFNNDVFESYPFFAQNRIGCTCWGFVAGKYQTYEPWEVVWKRIDEGRGQQFDVTKWFHDLYRPSLRPYDPNEIAVIKYVNAQMDAERRGNSLRAEIAKSCKITKEDMWNGYRRTHFVFNGRQAWIAEPSTLPRQDGGAGVAWIWSMLWPDCDVDRTHVARLLKDGFHYAYIDLFDTRMHDAGVVAAAEFQSFLVKNLGFAPKANLVGISWGGFMAARYAAERPDNVARMYLDNALLTFDGYDLAASVGLGAWADATKRGAFAWSDDPRMPVNNAGKIAKAGIKVMLVYGTSDVAIKPSVNSRAFAAKFNAAGGKATVLAHPEYGHHPHGVEPAEARTLIDFFSVDVPARNDESLKAALAMTEAKTWQSPGGGTLPYRLHKPSKREPGRRYPLVVFMHGAGSRGSDNVTQLRYGGAPLLNWAKRTGQEFFMVAPQCPEKDKWVDTNFGAVKSSMKPKPTLELAMAMEIIDDACKRYPIDFDRIYVIGISMGGYATWELLQRRPRMFAAALPCCGGGDVSFASRLTGVPIWAFHGDADKTVPVCRTRDMVSAIKAAGGRKILYREYKGKDHDVWTPTFSDDSVFEWLFSQKRQPAK